LRFEEGWQVGKWGMNEGEAWSASGGNIKAKWGKYYKKSLDVPAFQILDDF